MKKILFLILLFVSCKKEQQCNPIFNNWKSITGEASIPCNLSISMDYMLYSTPYYMSFKSFVTKDSIYELFQDSSYSAQFGYKINSDTLTLFPIYPSYSVATKFIKY